MHEGSKVSQVCQVHESVCIQATRERHILLNSRSEFNRCALPRLEIKMGEKEYSDRKEEEENEKEEEEEINKLIKEMKKRKKKGESPL